MPIVNPASLPLSLVILAAGQGKRMNSLLPKVLHPLAGKPLLAHVIQAAVQLKPQQICVVVGHGGENVRQALSPECGEVVTWVKQEPQLGTGHAVQQALSSVNKQGVILVLYGDVPLVTVDTLARLVDKCSGVGLSLLTQALDNPTGYGRIVRDAAGKILRIVEEKDAHADERKINEKTGTSSAIARATMSVR